MLFITSWISVLQPRINSLPLPFTICLYENDYFVFMFKEFFYWTLNYKFTGFSQCFSYMLPLSSDFHCLCWEVSVNFLSSLSIMHHFPLSTFEKIKTRKFEIMVQWKPMYTLPIYTNFLTFFQVCLLSHSLCYPYTCIHIYMHICMFLCIHLHIYMHTHTSSLSSLRISYNLSSLRNVLLLTIESDCPNPSHQQLCSLFSFFFVKCKFFFLLIIFINI